MFGILPKIILHSNKINITCYLVVVWVRNYYYIIAKTTMLKVTFSLFATNALFLVPFLPDM